MWWLAFEKKPFQFWRKIWIQVVVILSQLYAMKMHLKSKTSAKLLAIINVRVWISLVSFMFRVAKPDPNFWEEPNFIFLIIMKEETQPTSNKNFYQSFKKKKRNRVFYIFTSLWSGFDINMAIFAHSPEKSWIIHRSNTLASPAPRVI